MSSRKCTLEKESTAPTTVVVEPPTHDNKPGGHRPQALLDGDAATQVPDDSAGRRMGGRGSPTAGNGG